MPRVYYDGFQITTSHRDRARARVFAGRSPAASVILGGQDSSAGRRVRDLASDLAQHPSYGISAQWPIPASEVPSDLRAAALKPGFGNSRRDKSGDSPLTSVMTTRPTPRSKGCQTKTASTSNTSGQNVDTCCLSRKRWCFFADIVGVDDFIRRKFSSRTKRARWRRSCSTLTAGAESWTFDSRKYSLSVFFIQNSMDFSS